MTKLSIAELVRSTEAKKVPFIEPVVHRTVVRLSTSWWSDNRGLYQRKSLTYLKRKSSGFNCLEEEINNIGAVDAQEYILNFDKCEDGVYEVVANYGTDEFGHVDEVDYTLVPYQD